MKLNDSLSASYPKSVHRFSTRQTTLSLLLALTLSQPASDAAVLSINLRGATDFAILAGTGITIAGAVNSTEITGDIGTYSTPTITGLENLILHGLNHGGNTITQQGKIDLGIAYNDATLRTATVSLVAAHDLGGSTLTPGIYNSPTSLYNNGVLMLDAEGDSNAVWIFQMGSTLTTASASSVELINGAQSSNVFWQVGSSATLGTGSHLEGTILAQASITATTNATFTGRLLAMDGAVSLDSNTIVIPEAGSTMLFAASLVLVALNRRRTS